MKKIKLALRLYILVFCSAFIIGGLNGTEGRNKGAMRYVLDHIYLQESSDGLVLTYTCQQESSHVFFIEKDLLQASISQELENILGSTFENPIGSITQNAALLTAIAGGPSGYLTLSSLSNTKSSKKPGRIMYTILSALAGYSAGYWATSEFPLFCNSGAVKNILEEKSQWIKLEKAYILSFLDTMARETRHTLYGIKRGVKRPPEYDAFFYCQAQDQSDVDLLHKNVRQKGTSLKEDDFRRLIRLKQRLSLAESTEGYFKLKTKPEQERIKKISNLLLKGMKIPSDSKSRVFKKATANLQAIKNRITAQKGEKSNHELCLEIEKEMRARKKI